MNYNREILLKSRLRSIEHELLYIDEKIPALDEILSANSGGDLTEKLCETKFEKELLRAKKSKLIGEKIIVLFELGSIIIKRKIDPNSQAY